MHHCCAPRVSSVAGCSVAGTGFWITRKKKKSLARGVCIFLLASCVVDVCALPSSITRWVQLPHCCLPHLHFVWSSCQSCSIPELRLLAFACLYLKASVGSEQCHYGPVCLKANHMHVCVHMLCPEHGDEGGMS